MNLIGRDLGDGFGGEVIADGRRPDRTHNADASAFA
jgi:hypothetical protein